jgi:hypothetical protein
MNCRVCEQKLRARRTDDAHHQEKSPIEPDVCLGCWFFALELEKYILRKTDRTLWTLRGYEVMQELLAKFRDPNISTVLTQNLNDSPDPLSDAKQREPTAASMPTKPNLT